MNGITGCRNGKGFSLVELLIVMAMMGIVTMAIYSLYEGTQRTASTQDEVVEVQQNLRIALDQIARDVRMAGFMIPSTLTPIATAGQNSLTIQTASAVGRAARIGGAGFSIPDPVGTPNVTFTLASTDQANLFAVNDYVRIIRPPNQNDLFPGRALQISSNPAGTAVGITGFMAADIGQNIRPGDVIVRIANGSNNPNTIDYFRANEVLKRRTDAGTGPVDTRDIASGLQQSADPATDGLRFSYVLDDGSVSTSVAAADLDNIKAVQITLVGVADTPQGSKQRSLTSLIELRNR